MFAATTNKIRRYPGLKPFVRSQSALFRGRSEDVQRLTNLIVRERLVVLFAKSGIGKTSLMQAGVGPELEAQGFAPVFLRADKTDTPLITSIGLALENNAAVGSIIDTDLRTGQPQTLWEKMKRLEYDLDGLPATPVLVLDQFEEIFTLTHTQASREQFLEEMADLANESIPEIIRKRLLEAASAVDDAEKIDKDIMQWWEKQPDLRIVISIRSDFLHLIDEISPLVPGILRNRYQLQPLTRRQAQEAIESPADAPGDFASPPFDYSPEAVKEILDYLAGRETSAEIQAVDATGMLKKQDEIESFNLQILCQHIEETIIRQEKPAGFVVEPPFYAGKKGLEAEIRDFYSKQVQQLPEAYARRTGKTVADPAAFITTAQRMIEEDLVTAAGRRCSMVDDFLTDRWKIDADFLDTLVDNRLLRKELRLDDFYYEITHDTLLPAIVDAREIRRSRERDDADKEKLKEDLREEAIQRRKMEEELQAVRKQRQLARSVSLLSLGMLALSLTFGIWFTISWAQSAEEEFLAAEKNCRDEQFNAADAGFTTLMNYKLKNWVLGGNIDSTKIDVQRFKRLYEATEKHLNDGDALFFAEGKEDFAGALLEYGKALDSLNVYAGINYTWITKKGVEYSRVDTNRIAARRKALDQRISSTGRILRTKFVVAQREAESFKDAGLWGQQMRNLLEMQRLLPKDPTAANELLKGELKLLDQSVTDYLEEELRECRAHLER